jgi:hypothetical protein
MSNRRIIISESEKRRIKNLYETPVSLDFVISDWLSPDEKYAIFLDELYDIESKTKLGNIWENFDNFKFFLKHSFESSTTVPQQIKEDVLKTLDSFLLTESTQNLTMLKPIFKQLLNEDWGLLGDLGNWVKDTAVGAVTGVADFVKTGYEGIKKLGIAISEGDWARVVDLLSKGALYVFRKVRAALYHPIGLILDAILMASTGGAAKGLLWIPWAMAVGLDIYELMTGDYENKELNMVWRLLFLGVDILGLTISGVAAKGPKIAVQGFIKTAGNTIEGISKFAKTNKVFSGILEKILKFANGAKGMLTKAFEFFKVHAPTLFKFFSGIMTSITKFINYMISTISKILSAPGRLVGKFGANAATQAGTSIGAATLAIGTYQTNKSRRFEDDLANSMTNTNVNSEYDVKDV